MRAVHAAPSERSIDSSDHLHSCVNAVRICFAKVDANRYPPAEVFFRLCVALVAIVVGRSGMALAQDYDYGGVEHWPPSYVEGEASIVPESWPGEEAGAPLLSEDSWDTMPPGDPSEEHWGEEPAPPRFYLPCMSCLGLRHSYTNGRNVGLGGPLVGTSWLNRPYYFGGELGPLWITRSMSDSVSRDTDAFGGLFLGWDWDHYWGSELRFDWAEPELENRLAPDAPRTDSFFTWSYSFMYYPWGDSNVRPYWRWGIGNTHVDFPTVWGNRRDEWLLTFPIGLGVKYPIRRWLALRAEFTDLLAVGQNGIPTQHNLALTFGAEWHFGVRPKSYWPWYPSRHYR